MNTPEFTSITCRFDSLNNPAIGPLNFNNNDIELALSASSTQQYSSALKRISHDEQHSPFPAICQYMQLSVIAIKQRKFKQFKQCSLNPVVIEALYKTKAVDSAIMFKYVVFTAQCKTLLALTTFTTDRLPLFAFPSDYEGLSHSMITFVTKLNLEMNKKIFSNILASVSDNTSQLPLYEDVLTAVIAFQHSLAFNVLNKRISKGLHIPTSLFTKLLRGKTPLDYLQTPGLKPEQKHLVLWILGEAKQPSPIT